MCPIGTAIFVNFKSIPSFFSHVSRTEENAATDDAVVSPMKAAGKIFLKSNRGEIFRRKETYAVAVTEKSRTIAALKKTGFHNFAITSYPFSQKRRVREETMYSGSSLQITRIASPIRILKS